MEKYIPTFTDISDWQINVFQNTGGTRSKKIALHPESGKEYFFKGSKELATGEIRYPTEFWSEIVSSKIGQYLGFNMLDYNIGYNINDKQRVGCLSKSMVEYSENRLTEGKSYLSGFNPKYKPETDKKEYTFQFICDSLKSFGLDKYIPELVEIMIFDAIISNSDRHQENWAFITYYRETTQEIEKLLQVKKESIKNKFILRLVKWFIKKLMSTKANLTASILQAQSGLVENRFSPIYDSGCCLGREHSDDKVKQLLKDKQQLESYVNKGTSEIHWQGSLKKRRHFELVNLLREDYDDTVIKVIQRVRQSFKEEEVALIINNIDKQLPSNIEKNAKLTEHRKELMVKIISLRTQKLLEIK